MSDKLLEEARDRFKRVVDAETDQRERMLDDIRFESGEQWPEAIKKMRESDPDGARPCLVVNKAKKHKNSLVNSIRQNRPQIRVLPVDSDADPETAEMLNGLIRHIQVQSDADIAYDNAAESGVTCGLGYFQLTTEVVDDEYGEQDIRISPIYSPFSVYMDPESEHPAGADAEWCFVTDVLSREKAEAIAPDVELLDWQDVGRGDADMQMWYESESAVRIATYWRIEEDRRNILYTPFGEFEEGEYWEQYQGYLERPEVIGTRWQTRRRAHWSRMLGNAVIESGDFPSRFIPIVRVCGEVRRIEGKRDYRGLIRDIKDPCRMGNYWRSLNTELVALAPKAPYLAPVEAIEGYEEAWQRANVSNKSYLPYNGLDEAGNQIDRPQRAAPLAQNMGLIQAIAQADDDVRDVSGQSEATFGEQGNEKSGRAIIARRQEGDENTFHFSDNLVRSLKHAGRILVGMIPEVYDTRRVIRTLGEDDAPGFATLDPNAARGYQEQRDAGGGVEQIFNPSVGRYDVTVNAGPSYASRRQEAADAMTQMVQAAPQLLGIIGDKMVRAMDWPGAEDMADRLKAMLPPELKEIEDAKEEGAQGAQAQMQMAQQAVMAQVAPMVEQLKAALDAAGVEVDEKDAQIAALAKQLEDKGVEYQLKGAEIASKAQAEQARVEADVVIAALGAGGEESGEPKTATADVSNIAAAQAVQQSAAQMADMASALAEAIDRVQMMSAGAAQAVADGKAAQDDVASRVGEIQNEVHEAEAKRERTMSAVLEYLKGPQTETAFADAVRTIETVH